ncbi:hypothetical protein L3X38_026776 [Prunus dulcis]|uniref:Uncharacterized protein n=1 Tax=Prunus dulcis TaxID=3755 RepID=A0AAD4VLP4_PRUDU|nr:hypothetical protein L3X38_026776 [Prunus dulcis]
MAPHDSGVPEARWAISYSRRQFRRILFSPPDPDPDPDSDDDPDPDPDSDDDPYLDSFDDLDLNLSLIQTQIPTSNLTLAPTQAHIPTRIPTKPVSYASSVA